ncbi:MAG: hypothetical protein GY838_14395 [bacterium]|nr:hypothetical protein [bacterium]
MARTEFTRGRVLGLTVATVVILVGLAAATGHVNWSPWPAPSAEPTDDWTEVLAWDFADGPHPEGWGWGTWRFVDGTIELDAGRGEWSVYFTPAIHESDFIMETSVQLISGLGEGGVRAHLLTRDSNQMTHESGMVLAAPPGEVAVRHMVNEVNHTSDLIPSPIARDDHGWHDMKFAAQDGLVSAWIDGRLVFESDEPAPPGYYTEPHFSVESGVARFRDIRIWSSSGTRPRSGVPGISTDIDTETEG